MRWAISECLELNKQELMPLALKSEIFLIRKTLKRAYLKIDIGIFTNKPILGS